MSVQTYIYILRWVLLLPALVLAFLISHVLLQLFFPLIQAHVGISNEDLYGMSIMDQEFVFGPYGEGIFAFFSVLVGYATAPCRKIFVAIAILISQLLLSFGVMNFTVGIAIGGTTALFLAVTTHRAIGFVRPSNVRD